MKNSSSLPVVAFFLGIISFSMSFVFFFPKADAEAKTKVSSSAAAHQITIEIKRDSDGATAQSKCSATAIGRNLLLTATHCFEMPDGVKITGLSLEGVNVVVEKHIKDDADHSILILSGVSFKVFSKIYFQETLKEGDVVHWSGWPGDLSKLYRRAYVSGDDTGFTEISGKRAYLLDAQAYPGDSGSGLYDVQGRLVGVVSYLRVLTGTKIPGGERIQLVGVLAFDFTKEQQEEIKGML